MSPPPIPWTTFFAFLCGLAGAACLVISEQTLRPSRGHTYAVAIERGMRDAYAPDAEMLRDEALSHDARAAGYRWAERHALKKPGLCERLQGEYRAGCLDRTAEQAR
jgi:hypothetical protein